MRGWDIGFGLVVGWFAFLDGLAEEVFDLAVDAAEFVGRPFLEFPPEVGRDAQEKWFALFVGHAV